MSPSTRIPSLFIAAAAVLILTSSIHVSCKENPYEACLRRAFHLSPAPPIDQRDFWFCGDTGRAIFYSIRIHHKIPRFYLESLCKVLEDEEKVNQYIKKTFSSYDFDELKAGQSCRSVLGPSSPEA